jgi:uncharacterized membrane protein
LRLLTGVLLVSYPLWVWWGLSRGSPRVLALVLLGLLLVSTALRGRAAGRGRAGPLLVLPVATALMLGLAAWLDAAGLVLMVPVAINAVLLLAFGATLRRGAMPMVERFARLQEAELVPAQQDWCRTWTRIWCGFFLGNGGIALVLVLAAPLSWWAFYNGLLAYVLMGVLFASEWVLRRRRFAPHLEERR